MTIASHSELLALYADLRRVDGLRTTMHYDFRLPELDRAVNDRLSAVMNRYAGACGCNSGSLVMSLGVLALLLEYFVMGGQFASIGARELWWWGGWAITFAVVGKLVGLLWARWRMISVIRDAVRVTSAAEADN